MANSNFELIYNESSFPPWGSVGSEIGLGPWGKADGIVIADDDVGESQTERGRASDDLASVIVLRSMAWAHVLVGCSVPWNDATQVSADSINCVILKAILLGNQVMSITLESLNKLSVTFLASG